jgi:hypothetical protein
MLYGRSIRLAIMEMPKNSSIGMEQRYVVKEYDTLSINKIFIIDKDLI